jgi:16S rRNA (uracil1498-N3)-methyltransferase
MLRLFVPDAASEAPRVRIVGAPLRHLHTLRLGPGARLVLFDGAGAEHEVELSRVAARAAEGVIVATRRPNREPAFGLVLAPALLKGDRMDLVVEKATELGVRRIAPFVSRHVVGRGARLERWRRIAASAAEQSGRTQVPAIDAPVELAALVRAVWPPLRVLAWEGERTASFDELPATAAAAIAVVGPEGGFAADEVDAARDAGFMTVALAPRILRAETAAIVTAALCLHRWGDVGRLSSPDRVR